MTTTHLMIAEAIGFLVLLIPVLWAAFKHRERGDAWEDYAHGLEEERKEIEKALLDSGYPPGTFGEPWSAKERICALYEDYMESHRKKMDFMHRALVAERRLVPRDARGRFTIKDLRKRA